MRKCQKSSAGPFCRDECKFDHYSLAPLHALARLYHRQPTAQRHTASQALGVFRAHNRPLANYIHPLYPDFERPMRLIQPMARLSPPATRNYTEPTINLATGRGVAHVEWDTYSTLPARSPSAGAAMHDLAPQREPSRLISPQLVDNSTASTTAPGLIRDIRSSSSNGEYPSCMSVVCVGSIVDIATFLPPPS